MQPGLVIGHDVGTGGNKAVLMDTAGNMLASTFEPYPVHYPRPHWAEQDPEDWWQAVTASTRRLLKEVPGNGAEVMGMGFSGQMATFVPVDSAGRPLCRSIIWLDNRADEQARRIIRRLGGERITMLLAGTLPSGKDIVCKMSWLKEREPGLFRDTYKFLDISGYLVFRATGNMSVDHTGAAATGLLSTKTRDWSRLLTLLAGAPLDKMPDIKSSIEVAGELSPGAAREMGLQPGIPLIAGMGDIPAAVTGSGALDDGDAHINIGTSSWLCLSLSKPINLGRNGMVSVASADPGMSILIGESETAGACLRWFTDHFATPAERDMVHGDKSIFDVMNEIAEGVDPGSSGLVFTPWMYGERSPVPDTTLRGSFANLSLEHGREQMLRSIYEGVAFNLRWLIEAVGRKGLSCEPLRAIGGGAKSDVWMQIVADVTGHRVEAVKHPQEAGAAGCALAVAVALGKYGDYKDIKEVIKVRKSFEPRVRLRGTYDELYENFRTMYSCQSKIGRNLNKDEPR